jgi:hypothetical protein
MKILGFSVSEFLLFILLIIAVIGVSTYVKAKVYSAAGISLPPQVTLF